jgi:hypothetical protein
MYIAPWAGYEGDDRKKLIPFFWVNYFKGDGGRSERINLQPELDFKISSRFTTSLSAFWESNTNDSQYFDTFSDSAGGLHYTFAHLEQSTLSFTWRLGYTFTPNTSFQVYASPFISKRDLHQPPGTGSVKGRDYDDRYKPYTAVDPGGFNFQQFRSNVVFRWEYRLDRRCSWCGVRAGKAGPTSPKGRTPSGVTWQTSSTSGPTIRFGEGVVLVCQVAVSD